MIEVRGERVDSVVMENVLLMKLDVEGFEPTAFESSKGIIDKYKCVFCLLFSDMMLLMYICPTVNPYIG